MKNQEQKAFQKDLIISLILHLIFIGVFIYGLPSIFKKVQEEPDVITFEMLPVSDITNVRDQGVKTPEPKEIKKSQKIEKSAASPKENLEQKEETPKEEPKPVEKKSFYIGATIASSNTYPPTVALAKIVAACVLASA